MPISQQVQQLVRQGPVTLRPLIRGDQGKTCAQEANSNAPTLFLCDVDFLVCTYSSVMEMNRIQNWAIYLYSHFPSYISSDVNAP